MKNRIQINPVSVSFSYTRTDQHAALKSSHEPTFFIYSLHREAARLAIEATQHFFNSIRRQVNDTKFAEFLNLEFRETLQLSFVIDTTGSMSGQYISTDHSLNFCHARPRKQDERRRGIVREK